MPTRVTKPTSAGSTPFKVPVIVEIILERVTNISMGTEINAVNEFEDLALVGNDAPTAISLLD